MFKQKFIQIKLLHLFMRLGFEINMILLSQILECQKAKSYNQTGSLSTQVFHFVSFVENKYIF